MTTRSWDFLGMPLHGTKRTRVQESNTIVALLDTGIYIDAPSFNDEGFGPPPPKWKGKCDTGVNFPSCNNKVIGARAYNLDGGKNKVPVTPEDRVGHGTHTSSTAAGSIVKGASLYGLAKGTARGGVPGARIAMYKVCDLDNCPDYAVLAGFDDAIADGADLLSVSLGYPDESFLVDPIAIGSFHAMKKGMLVVCAAGNAGPYYQSVINVGPWMLTVAASNMDREFRTIVKLGNGLRFYGLSINTFTPNKTMYPLTSGDLAADPAVEEWAARACYEDQLLPEKVKGKIVLCQGYQVSDVDVLRNGAYGTILVDLDATHEDVADITLIPATYANEKEANSIAHYINTTKEPTALIHKTKTVKIDSLLVASFSSRGPQLSAPNILKPDIIAPGLDILAGYSKLPSLSGDDPDDGRHEVFNIISGTSMATPHVAGAAAYVKTFHPDWSPAAIMSALMTTAKPMHVKGIEQPLATGSGLLNPTAAVHPGLIYNMSLSSHISYLCRQGYNRTSLGLLTGSKLGPKCSDYPRAKGYDGINYPSMHLQFLDTKGNFSGVFYRTLTSVAPGNSTYKANVPQTKGLSVKIIPDTLIFTKPHEEKNFRVLVAGEVKEAEGWLSTTLEWNDGRHKVRTPIVVYRISPDDSMKRRT